MIVGVHRYSSAKNYVTKQSKNGFTSLLDKDSFCFASQKNVQIESRFRINCAGVPTIALQLYARVDARYASATQLNCYVFLGL